ncbi:MAG: transposase [Gemmatimonadaceae bacterium]|nr:transposase [Gemmatimonadaceae bacterium]
MRTSACAPHHVGGTIGVLAVLHMWTRALIDHPHVHSSA